MARSLSKFTAIEVAVLRADLINKASKSFVYYRDRFESARNNPGSRHLRDEAREGAMRALITLTALEFCVSGLPLEI
jgi:hypothetical protein